MNFKLILFLLFLCFKQFGQETNFSNKAQKLLGTFSVYHYQPINQNSQCSEEIVDLFIKELDHKGFVLKLNDCKALRKNAGQLLSEIEKGKDDYYLAAISIYLRALQVCDSVLSDLATKPFTLNNKDTISYNVFDNAGIRYSLTIKEYAKRMEKYMKLLSFNLISNNEDFDTFSELDFKNKASAAYLKIISNYSKKIQNEMKTCQSYVCTTLLNAMALRHDPHSNYFTEEQNEAFNTSLSAQVETFGFYLDETDDGQIFIADMDAGGPAWLCNDINTNDLLVSIKLGNEVLSAEDYSAADIQEKINSTKFSKLKLSIKKQNHILKSVELVKQKVSSAENHVKGYVLSENKIKIGYISLPSFYTDMEEHSKPGCANDVAKEILKLEKDSIQGLILDLRNNGGGSMEEAMNLAGIFIDEGPLFIYKEKNKKPSLVKDMNRGSIFKKPLIVMINEGSASASELFSNIMKDYQAGVIVGQKSYGKGTAQSVLPLDTNLLYSKSKNAAAKQGDYLKITMAKFYRLNCSTHQALGVVPDIIFPRTLGYQNVAENKESYYLAGDSVVKKVMYSAKPNLPISQLNQQSIERQSKAPYFKTYNHLLDSLSQEFNKNQNIVLNQGSYKSFKTKLDALYGVLENMGTYTQTPLQCLNNRFDLELEQVNEQSKEFNRTILTSIQSDIFIIEANHIMQELINQKK